MDKYERLKLHFTYFAGIFVGLLIIIASSLWTDQEKFTEILTNAATMTSLFLGVIAIFYSIVANGEISRSLGSINQVADHVDTAKNAMNKVAVSSEELLASVSENTNSLEKLSNDFNSSIEQLKLVSEKFESHTESVKQSLESLSPRFDVLEAKLSENASSGGKHISPPGPLGAAEGLDKLILSQLSLAGVFAVFGLALAHRHDRELNLIDYQKAIDVSSAAYLHGVVVTIDAANFVDLESIKSKARCYQVNSICPYFKSIDTDTILELVEMKTKNYQDESKQKWKDRVLAAEAYFTTSEPEPN